MKARPALQRRIVNRELFASVLETGYGIEYFERAFGLKFEREEIGGLGSFEVAGVEIGPSVCTLGRRVNTQRNERLVLDAPTNIPNPTTFVELAIGALELSEDINLVRFHEFTALSWELWREDDNGNRSLVARFARGHDANAMAKYFEERGHKQRYWANHAL